MDGNGVADEEIWARLTRLRGSLGAAGQRVAALVVKRPATVLAGSALEIAALAQTSDATVVRTAQLLGYGGLADLKQALAATMERQTTPKDHMRNTLSRLGTDAVMALDSVLDAHAEAVKVLRSATFRTQLGQALKVLHVAERVVTFGIGPTAHLARYAAGGLTRSGRRSVALDAGGVALADQILQLQGGDAVLAFAYGRPYREIDALFGEAQRLGLPIVLVSDALHPTLEGVVDAVLTIPRGRNGQVALHGGTLVGLEVLLLALAASNHAGALESLDRLNRLRVDLVGRSQRRAGS